MKIPNYLCRLRILVLILLVRKIQIENLISFKVNVYCISSYKGQRNGIGDMRWNIFDDFQNNVNMKKTKGRRKTSRLPFMMSQQFAQLLFVFFLNSLFYKFIAFGCSDRFLQVINICNCIFMHLRKKNCLFFILPSYVIFIKPFTSVLVKGLTAIVANKKNICICKKGYFSVQL